ncbi:hypothetical protein HanIR_Chr13g0619031 [Helianthus annuus]|nr:hypothetical protein HanIR_Chr13g0619031 [Helianthus annuus]
MITILVLISYLQSKVYTEIMFFYLLQENIGLLEKVQGKRYKHLYKPLKKTGRVLYKAKRLQHVSYIHRRML